MSQLTLVTDSSGALKPVVAAALQNELRVIVAGIRRTERRLQDFEARFGMPTLEFIRRYEDDEMEETLDFAEWIGEARLLDHLKEKRDVLRGVRIAD